MPNVAVAILSCREFEDLELALVCILENLDAHIPVFVLQNCRGDYDAERTMGVARRCATLYAGRVRVIDDIAPGPPYASLRTLIDSPHLAPFDLICKIDGDSFPVTANWLQSMVDAFLEAETALGPRLAYVTPLIPNNCWGFAETLRLMELESEYFATLARPHVAGFEHSEIHPPHLVPANHIDTAQNGTIWSSPYVARWLHRKTTFDPDRFIAATASASPCEVPATDRYSISCILFRPQLWRDVDNGQADDEHMLHLFCRNTPARIVCARSVPFVHFAYFSQREENRDLVRAAHELYARRLGLPFPISLHATLELENESRLRWLDRRIEHLHIAVDQLRRSMPRQIDAPAVAKDISARIVGDPELAEKIARQVWKRFIRKIAFWRRS